MRKALAILAATILTACGGGGGSTSSTAPVAKACQATRIQLFGDSTQWGLDVVTHNRAAMYPELALQQAMDQRFGLGRVVVSTRAVSGTDTTKLLAGTDGLNAPWPQSVAADIVVINHGINDTVSIDQYKANLRALLKAPAQVVLETNLPMATGYAEINNAMRTVATETGTVLIDSNRYALSLPAWSQYSPDGMHATGEGYALIARNAKMPVLAPMVEKLRAGCQ